MNQGIPTIENNVVHHNGDDDLTGSEIGTKETRIAPINPPAIAAIKTVIGIISKRGIFGKERANQVAMIHPAKA